MSATFMQPPNCTTALLFSSINKSTKETEGEEEGDCFLQTSIDRQDFIRGNAHTTIQTLFSFKQTNVSFVSLYKPAYNYA